MNILFIVLAVFFGIVAFVVFVDAVSNGSKGFKSELIPFTLLMFFCCAFLFLYIEIHKTEYTIFVTTKDNTFHEDISETIVDGVKTSIVKISHECIIRYEFDRELILGDKSDLKHTVDSKCSELDREFINDQVDEYKSELNGNQD